MHAPHISAVLIPSPLLQASEGRSETMELARRVNDYQGRLRAVTRKVMATVSELSMYQVNGRIQI